MAVVTTSSALALPSDEQLLQRHARGEQGVLEELFRRYRQLAYRVAYRLLGHEADALDAVQEGFVKALTHLHGFQGRSSRRNHSHERAAARQPLRDARRSNGKVSSRSRWPRSSGS